MDRRKLGRDSRGAVLVPHAAGGSTADGLRTKELARLAIAAIGRIEAPSSELAQLWADGGGSERWFAANAELKARLRRGLEDLTATD
jgi:hypothetical protein